VFAVATNITSDKSNLLPDNDLKKYDSAPDPALPIKPMQDHHGNPPPILSISSSKNIGFRVFTLARFCNILPGIEPI